MFHKGLPITIVGQGVKNMYDMRGANEVFFFKDVLKNYAKNLLQNTCF